MEINTKDLDHGTFQASLILFEKLEKPLPRMIVPVVKVRKGMTKAAGKAFLGRNLIRYSKEFFDHGTEEAKIDTIIHETCHMYAYRLFLETGHDYHWRRLMLMMERKPEKYWNFNNSMKDPVAAKEFFKKKREGFSCPHCSFELELTPNMATRIRNKTTRKRVCPKCRKDMGS